VLVIITWLTILNTLCAQPAEAIALEKRIYRLNNNFQYDSSKTIITKYLETPSLSPEKKFYGFLYLSYTFKRLFDYGSTLKALDSANHYGSQTSTPGYFAANISCQKAYVYFDTRQYPQADSLMQLLAKNGYTHINNENKSKLMMQGAYLLYLDKNYPQAEAKYNAALNLMKSSSPCDLPMIYGKLIELYASIKKSGSMHRAYKNALYYADSCGIMKYRIYATEMMAAGLAITGDYKQAMYYTGIRDSLKEIYTKEAFRDELLLLEAKHQAEKNEQHIALQQKSINSKNILILLLLVSFCAASIATMYYLLIQRQRKVEQGRINTQRYTSQLLQKTEEDRKRIAGHLHDSLNHELLSLKNMLSNDREDVERRIDMLIDDVRQISHHLHPVVFSKVGLEHSISELVERIQVNNNFMLTAEVDYHKVLSLEAELQLYRIIQEAVSNMVKHSNAIAGKITVKQTTSFVMVEIKDNGMGFDVPATLNSSKAFGLHNVLERSRAAGGTAHIMSDQNGTTITIKIQLKNK